MRRLLVRLACAGLFAGGLSPLPADAQRAPALDPPVVAPPGPEPPSARRPGGGSEPLLEEWALHKTADGAHPDGVEQAYVWLMNRARRDPAAEGAFLAHAPDSGVQGAIGYFDVDVALLQQEFAASAARPPAAFDARLYEAALAHSLDLIARNAQDHSGQFARVADAGFHYWSLRGNVFAFAREPLFGHAGFNIDWGGKDGTGMQPGRGHRQAVMGIDSDYSNVGIAAVLELDPDTFVGPSVVTGNYARAATSYPDHHNRFLVGTVWEDLDADGLYDPGEGIEGVTVLPSRGPWFAVTAAGGGYAIPVLAEGAIGVDFEGGGVPFRTLTATVGATSVLVDYVVPEPAGAAPALVAGLALGALARRRQNV